MKNYWKILFISAIIVSVLLVAGAAIFNWNQFENLPSPAAWRENQFHSNPPQMQDIPIIIRLSISFISGLLAGFIFLFLLPKQINNIAQRLNRRLKPFLRLLLGGFFTSLLLLTIGAGSTFALPTFPVLFLLILAEFLIVWIGYVAIAFRLGNILQQNSGWFHQNPLLSFALGHLILFAALQIPILNIIVTLIIASLGAGAVIATRFGSNQPWNLQHLKEGSL